MNQLRNTENSRCHKALLKFWTICVKTGQQLSISPVAEQLNKLIKALLDLVSCAVIHEKRLSGKVSHAGINKIKNITVEP